MITVFDAGAASACIGSQDQPDVCVNLQESGISTHELNLCFGSLN